MRPRDPFCVVVFWDVTPDALNAFAASTTGGSWRLRLRGEQPGEVLLDEALPDAVDHCFFAVPSAGSPYSVDLGFRFADGSWRELTRSTPVTTPTTTPVTAPAAAIPRPPDAPLPHAIRPPTVVEFAENAGDVPDPWVADVPIGETSEPLSPPPRRARMSLLPPAPTVAPAPATTPMLTDGDNAAILLSLIWETTVTPATPSSAEVTHWVARVISGPGSRPGPGGAAPIPASAETVHPIGSPPSSPEYTAAPTPARDFWFEVNAELIVYGRTEPTARVTIGGRPVALRPDGSFRFRFSLPDGAYELPVIAVNAEGDDGRTAHLEFSRSTEIRGVVGVHPQDPALRPPTVEAVG